MLASTTFLKLPKYCKCLVICIGNIMYYEKNVNEISEIEVFLGSNLSFAIRNFTWDLANDDNICKN